MKIASITSIKRLFRSPKVIIGELTAIAIACAGGTSLGLDHTFQSPWFLAITGVTALSLAIVVYDQFRRMMAQWTKRPSARLIGSPFFHLGLLLIICAGFGRALFGTEAIVDLVEGETLTISPSAWSAHFPAIFAKPFHLPYPITLNTIHVSRYNDGALRDLSAKLTVQKPTGNVDSELSINHELMTTAGRLFISSDFGPTALLEWRITNALPYREAVIMAHRGQGIYEGSSSGSNGLLAHVRTTLGPTVKDPARLELRIMRDSALMLSDQPQVGQTLSIQSGESLTLLGTPLWVRLRGNRDPALWLAYTGFGFVIIGALTLFGLPKTGVTK